MQNSGEPCEEKGGMEDDMAEGDLGDGMGRRPGGIYEKGTRSRASSGHSSRGSLGSVPAGLHTKASDNGSPAFQWTSYNTLYTVFRQGLDLERPPTHWTLTRTDSVGNLSTEELKQRLQELTEEVEVLRSELEVAQRRLEGKHEALKILQSRAVFDKATSHTKTLLQKSEERNKVLEKEVNGLQWEITFNQVQFRNIEQSWTEKYDRKCSENKALSDALEDKATETHQLKSENSALSQQCLELLAMLSVKEQKIFQGSLPSRSSAVREGTALELAVLGACNCSASQREPCPCACSAAASRKQVLQLKQELEVQKKRKEEAYVMADAFRIAFEQQLKRRSDQTLRLTETEGYLRKDSFRREEGGSRGKGGPGSVAQRLRTMLLSSAEGRRLDLQDDPVETLQMLVDLLNDKEEALAHQRKVSYMLARNTEELERRLRQLHVPGDNTEEGDSLHLSPTSRTAPGSRCHTRQGSSVSGEAAGQEEDAHPDCCGEGELPQPGETTTSGVGESKVSEEDGVESTGALEEDERCELKES
ncbi:coiled-coil domain-containing protein 125 isoform X2 [Amia ocellicauda]